jgi:hypothetical protein
MSYFDRDRALVFPEDNMIENEGENADKRVDGPKNIANCFDITNERIFYYFAHGLDCRDAGTTAGELRIYVQNSISDVSNVKYSQGMANSGYEIYAFDSASGNIWWSTAPADDIIAIDDTDLIAGSTVADYNTLKNSTTFYIRVTQAPPGFKIGKGSIAFGILTNAVGASDIPLKAATTHFLATDDLNTIIDTFDDDLYAEHVYGTGVHGAKVIKESNLATEALANLKAINYVNGGMEYADAKGYPLGWVPVAAGVLSRDTGTKVSGTYSAKVVASGADQGMKFSVSAYNLRSLKGGQNVAYSAFVYSSLTSIKVTIYDGFSTQTNTKTVTAGAWSYITGTFLLNTAVTEVTLSILSTAADTFYVDEAMLCGGVLPIRYIESSTEWETRDNFANVYKNLMLNGDFSMFYPPYSGGSADLIYYPLSWVTGSTGILTASSRDTANAKGGTFAWLLKQGNMDDVWNDCIAPTPETAKRFQGSIITFGIEVKAHATSGADQMTIYIEDDVIGKTKETFTPPAAATFFYVTTTIDAAATWVRVGIENDAGSADFFQVYISKCIAKIGDTPMAWYPGDYHKQVTIMGADKAAVITNAFLDYGTVTGTANTGPAVEGTIIAIRQNIQNAAAPVGDYDEWQLVVNGSVTTVPHVLAINNPDKFGVTSASFDHDSTSPTIVALTLATNIYGARIQQQCLSASSGTPGTTPIGVMDVFVIK